MYSSDDYNEGGYESYGDYEPHTGDPQYDLEYDRSYYKMPEMVIIHIINQLNHKFLNPLK
ncbi:hypothetical protein RR48_06937 [Papilio machaon]|uniref:Uncharacterized protein n=1 Tax=Papilio machaon TaxID=76193 RepID=A0A194R979_PAPMA|nr:hypothetical protein RR48_06937 [Papilio machaon]